jgi:hypothetical protein
MVCSLIFGLILFIMYIISERYLSGALATTNELMLHQQQLQHQQQQLQQQQLLHQQQQQQQSMAASAAALGQVIHFGNLEVIGIVWNFGYFLVLHT